jgi:uncharacterized protein with GYD domain
VDLAPGRRKRAGRHRVAFGQDDGIAIYDLPDNVTAASLSIAANAVGHVHLSITPLVTVEEMDQAIAKSAKYRVP